MSDNSNKEPSAQSGLQRMMDSAITYFLAGERCNQPMSFGQYPEPNAGTPTIVLYAFSIELALKVLLQKNDISYSSLKGAKGHSIKALFELLPQFHKDELGYFNLRYSSEDPTIIEQLDHAFKDWRYHVEKEILTVSTTDLNRLFMAVHSRIRTQFPDFMSSLEYEWGAFEFDLLHHKTSLKICPESGYK